MQVLNRKGLPSEGGRETIYEEYLGRLTVSDWLKSVECVELKGRENK